MVFYPHVFSNACKTFSYSLCRAFLWEKHMWPTLLLFIKKDVADILILHITYLFPPSSNFSFSSTESQKNLMGSPSPLLRLSFSQVHIQCTNPSLNGNFCHRSQHALSYQGCYRWNLCNVDKEISSWLSFNWRNIFVTEYMYSWTVYSFLHCTHPCYETILGSKQMSTNYPK